MSESKEFRESSRAYYSGDHMIESTEHDHGYYLSGYVVSVYGIIGIYANVVLTDDIDDFVYLSFFHNGRVHERRFSRSFTNRGLVIKARTFAEDVVREAKL